MSKENEEIVEERIYTIPLSKAWSSPKKRRTPRAIRVLKDFIRKHMKPETLLISTEVNEFLWSHS
jgi:large subunit ribosomal protein L31e